MYKFFVPFKLRLVAFHRNIYVFRFLLSDKGIIKFVVRQLRFFCFLLPGNASLEAAIDWIVDHENDPDIDQMPLV